MVCYSVPLTAAVLLFIARKRSGKESDSLKWLNLLLAGGAVMLVIDHSWNGELFLLSGSLFWDLMLGVAMTLGAVVFWGIMLATGKTKVRVPTQTKA